MYCIHCGKWVEGEADTCPDCAAAHSAPAEAPAPAAPAPEAPVYTAPVYTAPVYTAPVYTAPAAPVYAEPTAPVYAPPAAPVYREPDAPVYTPAEDTFRIQPPEVPTKKKNGKKIALICILAAVAAIAVLAVVFWDNIIGLFTKSSGTPAEQLQAIEEQALNNSIDALTDAYGQYMNAVEPADTAISTEIHLLLGDSVVELLNMSLEQEGIPITVDWLSDIAITGTVQSSNDAYQLLLGLGLGNTHLLSANIVADVAGDQMWMGFPEFSGDHLYFERVAELTGISMAELIASSQSATQEMLEALPAPEVLNSLLKKYGSLITDYVQDVQTEPQTVTQGELTQEFTVFTAKIYPTDLLNMAEAALTELKNDRQAQDILVKIAAYGTYTSEAMLRADLLEAIDEVLEDIAEEKNDLTQNNGDYLLISTYVDGNEQICGRTISLHEGSYEQQILHALMVTGSEQFSMEFDMSGVILSGTGTQVGDVTNGTFTMIAEGMEMLHIQLVDFTEQNGIIRLIPSRAIMEEALYELGVNGIGILSGMDVVLELETRMDDTEYVGMKLLLNEEMLFGITATSRRLGKANIQLPSGGVDVMDDAASIQWFQSLDFSALMDNLSKAGMPDDLAFILSYYLDMMQSSIYY